ncbi:glycosyltransferase family protein [Alphaproteobacteria bacterium]|nr:glycosyltransferase family protein [Alphaproteobacteria bacterium]
MKIVATIEARMTSSRLPGKVLMKILDKPILHYLVARLKQVELIDEIVLATTVNSQDNNLIEFANNENIKYYRGSEDDVMLRVFEAAKSVDADLIVEITGDCPIIDYNIIEQAIQTYINNKVDYVSNAHVRSYPDGMDVQVFSVNLLEKSLNMTDDILDHEHVTLHIRNHPELFSHLNLVAPKKLWWPELGLTLDEKSDFELLKKIIEHFKDDLFFNCYEIIDFLRKNPRLLSINQKIVRRHDT